jgi:hypothetical protein
MTFPLFSYVIAHTKTRENGRSNPVAATFSAFGALLHLCPLNQSSIGIVSKKIIVRRGNCDTQSMIFDYSNIALCYSSREIDGRGHALGDFYSVYLVKSDVH